MRITRFLLTVAFLLLFIAGNSRAKTASQFTNTTVLIIRHAEKPATGKDLSIAGVGRAKAYVSYFHSFRIDSQPAKIDHLFATHESKNSDRPRETLVPLSDALHLKIHTAFDLSEDRDLVGKVSRSYNGQTILVCWHHGAIPDLLQAFGANPKALLPGGRWPEEVFGWIIVLHYDRHGRLAAHVYNEGLMPDDKSHPPPKT